MKFTGDQLSVEHRRQIAKFCGLAFDDEEDKRLRAYVAFKRWHFALLTAAADDGHEMQS